MDKDEVKQILIDRYSLKPSGVVRKDKAGVSSQLLIMELVNRAFVDPDLIQGEDGVEACIGIKKVLLKMDEENKALIKREVSYIDDLISKITQ